MATSCILERPSPSRWKIMITTPKSPDLYAGDLYERTEMHA
jgi:hypothetical protein